MVRKYVIGFLGLTISLMVVAFTQSPRTEKKSDPTFATFYFQFSGTKNLDESDRTKWSPVSQGTYNSIGCSKAHLGCKLIASDTVMISGTARPKAVYVVSGTNDPTTGAYVSAVSNFQN